MLPGVLAQMANSQGESHDIVTAAVTVLAVVDQRHAEPVLREVSPLVGTDLAEQRTK